MIIQITTRTKTGDEQDHTVQKMAEYLEKNMITYNDCENESNVDKTLDESCKDFIGVPKSMHYLLKEMARCAKTYKEVYWCMV